MRRELSRSRGPPAGALIVSDAVLSSRTARMFEDDERARGVRAGFLARVPIGRLGEPEDLAGPLLFLCSRASDFHTGHIVYADGGYTAG